MGIRGKPLKRTQTKLLKTSKFGSKAAYEIHICIQNSKIHVPRQILIFEKIFQLHQNFKPIGKFFFTFLLILQFKLKFPLKHIKVSKISKSKKIGFFFFQKKKKKKKKKKS